MIDFLYRFAGLYLFFIGPVFLFAMGLDYLLGGWQDEEEEIEQPRRIQSDPKYLIN